MNPIAIVRQDDESDPLQLLEEAGIRLASADGVLAIDLTSVRRVDAQVIQRLEELVSQAEGRGIKVTLRGVRVDHYKVFTLVKLATRFAFDA
jgi:anti-anti-sigma regulatory factor